MEVVAARTLNALYVWLDVAWLIVFGAILLWQRKRTAFLAGLIGGVVYFAVGYGILILRNLRAAPGQRVHLLWLLAIGIGVQPSWEFVLLISGIRPAGLAPLMVNSLIETNMGMPYFYLIHQAVARRGTS
jgi:hypothetical protein